MSELNHNILRIIEDKIAFSCEHIKQILSPCHRPCDLCYMFIGRSVFQWTWSCYFFLPSNYLHQKGGALS